MGVYAELQRFLLEHQGHGQPAFDAETPIRQPATGCGSSARAVRGSIGSVTPDEADDDLLRSALLAFEN